MKTRLISGAVFVALVVGFFLLRDYVDYRLFNVFIWFLCAVGTFEVARALKKDINKITFVIIVTFGIVFCVNYAITEYLLCEGYGALISLFVAVLVAVIAVLFNRKSENALTAAVPTLYPALLILSMLCVNDLFEAKFGFLPMLLVFVVSPASDTMAYLVGMTYNKLRKGKAKKLCPKLSPKKTVAGAIGGIIGGAIGALIVFWICKPVISYPFIIALGVFASAFTEIGDLFESYIKRRVNIKDMGKIMPGHGGVMDRIDGMSFASVVVLIFFLLV